VRSRLTIRSDGSDLRSPFSARSPWLTAPSRSPSRARERKDFGPDYHDHGVLFCWENGKPPHPDTITRRFKKLARAAGLPEIDLHDVRHSYATAGRNAKIDWKALSKRIGHADVAFTMKQYVQTDLEADREVANTLADLIIGGLLVTEIDDQGDEHDGGTA
jgi:integrase